MCLVWSSIATCAAAQQALSLQQDTSQDELVDWASEFGTSAPALVDTYLDDPACRVRPGSGYNGARTSGGADYLYIRPHFSEAIAFAEGVQSGALFQTTGQELEFGYRGSVRGFITYELPDEMGQLGFTYWRLEGETAVSGADSGPGTFIIDPFGHVVGTYTVVDPSDARFGGPVTGGDLIDTIATVETDFYDIYLKRSLWPAGSPWDVQWSIGARIARIDQFYSSVVTDTLGPADSQGIFTADFLGAGPRLGGEVRRTIGPNGYFTLYASAHMALLLGQYEVSAITEPTPGFETRQFERLMRTLPVVESELGLACQLTPRVSLTAGWVFQAWMDQGTSGGKFGGIFAGSDDANIMSFDGLVIRGEVSF